MVREIDGQTWFCCPTCGRKIHPVKPGARGVLAVCRQRRRDGTRCSWAGEIRWEAPNNNQIREPMSR